MCKKDRPRTATTACGIQDQWPKGHETISGPIIICCSRPLHHFDPRETLRHVVTAYHRRPSHCDWVSPVTFSCPGHRHLSRHVFADSHAQGMGEDPQWLYGVVFDEAELWPERTRPSSAQGLKVSIDAWEPYLEAV